MWRSLDNFGIGACFTGNQPHHSYEVIQCLARLRLGGLDHQRLVYDQWEVDGRRVHAKVEYALGDVEGRDTIFLLLAFRRGNELMLAEQRIGYFVVRLQLVLEVVRI